MFSNVVLRVFNNPKNTCKDDAKISGLNKWVGNNAF